MQRQRQFNVIQEQLGNFSKFMFEYFESLVFWDGKLPNVVAG